MLGFDKRGVGLDIGDDMVRAAFLKKHGQQLIVAGVGVSEMPPPDDQHGAAQAVLHALKDAGAKKRDPLVCAISGPAVVIKHIKLPAIAPSRVLEAVKWHFKETGLLPEEDAVFDAQLLGPSPNGEMNILAVCAPRALIDKNLKLLESAGLAPLHMDVGPLATLNAFLSLQRAARDETVVLLNLSERVSFVCLFNYQSGVPLVRYFSERLAGPARVVEDIRTSVMFYQAELAAADASLRCVYCGSQERFSELKEQMEGLFALWKLEEPPAAFDPLSILEWGSSILPPGKSIQGAELAQAVGLALRAL